MFTGIIESLGTLQKVAEKGSNKTFFIKSDIASQMKIDESICHNGVCLTVEDINNDIYKVTAIKETLDKTNIGSWNVGESINIERSMKMNGRLDGHIVQGHVDCTATCISAEDVEGSHEFTFEFDKKFAGLVIEKGSISLNGISLTIFNPVQNKRNSCGGYLFNFIRHRSILCNFTLFLFGKLFYPFYDCYISNQCKSFI